mmetsp:Transcript_13459/g.50071  ORF Transcript_13459/g.50071 Transcript_13459/m.50071 type:complete len:307 (-) Transcript_13459:2224-3144(-)
MWDHQVQRWIQKPFVQGRRAGQQEGLDDVPQERGAMAVLQILEPGEHHAHHLLKHPIDEEDRLTLEGLSDDLVGRIPHLRHPHRPKSAELLGRSPEVAGVEGPARFILGGRVARVSATPRCWPRRVDVVGGRGLEDCLRGGHRQHLVCKLMAQQLLPILAPPRSLHGAQQFAHLRQNLSPEGRKGLDPRQLLERRRVSTGWGTRFYLPQAPVQDDLGRWLDRHPPAHAQDVIERSKYSIVPFASIGNELPVILQPHLTLNSHSYPEALGTLKALLELATRQHAERDLKKRLDEAGAGRRVGDRSCD